MMASFSPPRLSAPEWTSLYTELLWIYDGPVAPAYRRTRPRRNDSGGWRARFLRKGVLDVVTRAHRIKARQGEWMISPPMDAEETFSDDAQVISVHFLCQWPTGEVFFTGSTPCVIRDADCPALLRAALAVLGTARKDRPASPEQFHRQRLPYASFLRRQGCFMRWLQVWCLAMEAQGRVPAHSGGRGDERLARAVRCLNEADLAAGFPRAHLLKEARLSAVQFNVVFHRAYGLTPWKYWERRRLDRARQWLATGDNSVKYIGYELGFKSDAHFVSWFRRLSGKSPGRFREDAG